MAARKRKSEGGSDTYIVRLSEEERHFLGLVLHRDGLLSVGASAARVLVSLQQKIPPPPPPPQQQQQGDE